MRPEMRSEVRSEVRSSAPASAFVHRSAVRFSDSDAMGHVNHARTLSYLEDARIALLRAAAGDGQGLPISGAILARLEVDYRSPVLLEPGEVTTSVWITRLGTSSVHLAYRSEQGGTLVAEATTVLVAYDYAAARSRPLSSVERAGLQAHLTAR